MPLPAPVSSNELEDDINLLIKERKHIEHDSCSAEIDGEATCSHENDLTRAAGSAISTLYWTLEHNRTTLQQQDSGLEKNALRRRLTQIAHTECTYRMHLTITTDIAFYTLI